MPLEIGKNIFGLDISDQAVRLVRLRGRRKKLVLVNYNEVPIPAGIMINGEIKQPDKLTALIEKLLKTTSGAKINGGAAVAVLPESKTFIKVITITKKKKDKLDELIKNEVVKHVPLDLEEMYLDWQIITEKATQAEVLVGIAPRAIVDSLLKTLEKANITPLVLEIEAAAIIRSLIDHADHTAKILIDFGAVRTGLIIYDHGTAQFTVSLPISGNQITETIAKTLNLEPAKAEKAKIICGLDRTKCEGALLKILDDSINQLVSEVEKAKTFYTAHFPNTTPIGEIILSGGGANFSDLDKILAEKLNLKVTIGNPLKKIQPSKKITIPANKVLSYTTAIGLAMRFFHSDRL